MRKLTDVEFAQIGLLVTLAGFVVFPTLEGLGAFLGALCFYAFCLFVQKKNEDDLSEMRAQIKTLSDRISMIQLGKTIGRN